MKGKCPIVYRKDLPARVGIFPKHAQNPESIRWFPIETCAIFHTLGAWEELSSRGDTLIHFVASRLPDFTLDLNADFSRGPTRVYHWVFNWNTSETIREDEVLKEQVPYSLDFLKTNPTKTGGKLEIKCIYFACLAFLASLLFLVTASFNSGVGLIVC